MWPDAFYIYNENLTRITKQKYKCSVCLCVRLSRMSRAHVPNVVTTIILRNVDIHQTFGNDA